MHKRFSDYINEYYKPGRKDLSNAFFMRLSDYSNAGGSVAFVSPSEWTYQRGYREFRSHILKNRRFSLLASVGRNAFDYGVRANPILSISIKSAEEIKAAIMEIDQRPISHKILSLKSDRLSLVDHRDWIGEADQRLSLSLAPQSTKKKILGDYAEARAGSYVGDAEQFERYFWEAHEFGSTFEFMQSSLSTTTEYGGRERAILWQNETGRMAELANSVRHLNHAAQNWRRGKPSWGRVGIALSLMGNLPTTIYTGEIYDKDCCAIVPKNADDLPALIQFFMSGKFSQEIRNFDKSLKVDSPKTLLSVAFDIDQWRKEANDKLEDNLPSPDITAPDQWLFSGDPNRCDTPLNVGVSRLLGFRWPRQCGFEFISYGSLEPDSLEEFCDHDGIVCLTATKGEVPAHERLSALLSDAFGADWSAARLENLLTQAGFAGKTLDDWLRDGFFEQHCTLYHQRPFIWHVWDGRRDGFHALINYHRLAAANGEGRRTLEKLI